jgi:uncharacterized protein (DUF779 family)
LGPQPGSEGRGRLVAGFVMGGLGVTLGVVAGAHFLWNKGRFDDWTATDAELTMLRAMGRPDMMRQQQNNELAESISRSSVITVSLGIGAAVLATTGLILIATAPSQPRAVATPMPTHAFGVAPGMLTWRMTY